MPVEVYCRGFPKFPCDTRSYMSALSTIMDDARTTLGSSSAVWTKDDVTYVDSGSYFTVFITYNG